MFFNLILNAEFVKIKSIRQISNAYFSHTLPTAKHKLETKSLKIKIHQLKSNYTHSPLYNKLQLCKFAFVDIRQKMGIRLRELRKEKALSQEKFALECELDRTYIASIEQGKRNVSIANVEKIAKALNMSVYEFFKSELFQK